ncbi:MAG: hypothetical protein AVDCRST_MAG38-2780 [uncultured Solirubrobacteraceae bacterium]|uniref:Uncharacterized protein n=1 Tax=uncultured Solirubrobacteraceae bacterium TaxID=1162706 RepID=A0A6J4SE35_9ACTN|nr:MAG: hypothetical protein AVDCRST_MAG38-2780 [uncultured Solirubrobacteraceae bacterium]
MLLLIVVLLVIALVVWAAYRAAVRRSAAAAGAVDRYRVLETTGAGQAHVFVSRGTPDSAVLIGSVPLTEADFDERYAALVVQAEDRVATLNASRELHAEG